MPQFDAIPDFIQAVGEHVGPNHELHDSPFAGILTHRFVCECGETFELRLTALRRTGSSSEQLFARHMETSDGRRRLLEALQPRCTVPPQGWRCRRIEGHDGPCAAEPTEERYITSEPVFVGEIPPRMTIPVRTELTILPADEPRQMRLGYRMSETLGTHNRAHRVTVTHPEPESEEPGRYPDRFHREEPV